MTRKDALIYAKVAGYHADSRSFIRLIVESRVSRQKLNEAWHLGVRAKEAGVPCLCRECNK